MAGREWPGLRCASPVGLGLDVGKEPVERDGHCGGPRAALESHTGFMQPDAGPVAAY